MSDEVNMFVAESPLQLINCVEAAVWAGGKKNILIVKYSNEPGRAENYLQLRNAIDLFAWDLVIKYPFIANVNQISRLNNEIKFIKRIADAHKNVNYLFIGEFRSLWMRKIRSVISPKVTYLVDDGNITLQMQDIYFSKTMFDLTLVESMRTYGLVAKAKAFIKEVLLLQLKSKNMSKVPINLFTVFNILPVDGQIVKKNKFVYFRGLQKQSGIVEERKVYYFGSKYSEAGVLSQKDELSFLKSCFGFFLTKKIPVVYIPHRDDSDEKIGLISSYEGVEVKRLHMPAELYMLIAKRRPIFIAGAYSTALHNLPILYSFKVVYSFALPFHLIASRFRVEIMKSYKNLIEQGVEVIDFYDQKMY